MLPWKCQVTWAVKCHIKLLPDKFWKKSLSLVAFALILKKLLTSKVAAGRIRPPGLNGVKRLQELHDIWKCKHFYKFNVLATQ